MSELESQGRPIDRRRFLWETGGGLGGIALASLLAGDPVRADTTSSQIAHGAIGRLHHPAKAKRVVELFMAGGTSHVDTFDHKPLLNKRHGQKWDPGEKVELFQDGLGATFCSPWKWSRYGECGKSLSQIVAPLGACVDEMVFIHSMIG